jgi:hypothetical protein
LCTLKAEPASFQGTVDVYISSQDRGLSQGMNATNYRKWLTEKLIPNLPPRSVLVVDNAPYHNVQFNKATTSQTTKAKMME